MRITLYLGAVALALAGCSTKPAHQYTGQYCYTDQEIIKNGGSTIFSETHLECTDRPSRKAEINRAGIDSGCKEFWYDEIRFGQRVRQRGVICEQFDGSVEIVNIDGNTK
jgi:hypothetical protein